MGLYLTFYTVHLLGMPDVYFLLFSDYVRAMCGTQSNAEIDIYTHISDIVMGLIWNWDCAWCIGSAAWPWLWDFIVFFNGGRKVIGYTTSPFDGMYVLKLICKTCFNFFFIRIFIFGWWIIDSSKWNWNLIWPAGQRINSIGFYFFLSLTGLDNYVSICKNLLSFDNRLLEYIFVKGAVS